MVGATDDGEGSLGQKRLTAMDRSLQDSREPPLSAERAGIGAAIAAGVRLCSLRGAADLPRIATDASVAVLGLTALVLWIALDRWRAGPGARFELWDTLTVSIHVLAVLGVAFVLSRGSRPRLGFRPVLFSMAAVLPVLIAAGFLIDTELDGRAAVSAWALLLLYALAYTAKALRTLSGSWQTRAMVAALVLSSAFVAYSRVAELSPSLWAPAASEDEEDSDMPASVAESLLFDQQAQIDEAVDRMSASEAGKPAVFFVGFAGVANQRVFAEEIKFAAHVVAERFGAAGRQLLLINDRRDLDTYPIATASGLAYALRAVAQKMDPQRDILFLSLSSHGSADALLSVSNGSLPLEQLTDDELSDALRESGIKRRIVVISACYAGAFIHSLEDPDTIVIAASAADRTSFGCSDDRDMTYFGEAFYRDALPGAKTIREAFERTKAAIAVREKGEHETPSEPQAFFGRDISALLENERR